MQLLNNVENVVAKGEIAHEFLLSSQCFHNLSAVEASESISIISIYKINPFPHTHFLEQTILKTSWQEYIITL